jgi:mono/diheme cytochrome c family protein
MTRLALLAGTLAFASIAHAGGDTVLARHDYLLQCAGCHGTDGNGSAVVPSLHRLAPLLAFEAGRDYLVRIPGVAQAPLASDRLAAVLNWVAAEFNQTNVAPPFTEAEVARGRAQPLRDPVAIRNRILAREPPTTASSASLP